MPTLTLITGSSGSGKTTISKALKTQNSIHLSLDSFYKTKPHNINASDYNFDSPEAFEWDLVYLCLVKLMNNETIEIPIYCFKTHTRTEQTETIVPNEYIFVDGIMIAFDTRIRELATNIIFIDTDLDECLIRRILRDIEERGRTALDVIRQWKNQVKPAYMKYVSFVRKLDKVIVFDNNDNWSDIENIKKMIFQK